MDTEEPLFQVMGGLRRSDGMRGFAGESVAPERRLATLAGLLADVFRCPLQPVVHRDV
jgi:hypothetical protein